MKSAVERDRLQHAFRYHGREDIRMKTEVQKILESEHLTEAAALPLSACRLIAPHKLNRFPGGASALQSVLVFLVPYFAGNAEERNLSLYAVARDYHLYFAGLFRRLQDSFSALFPDNYFLGGGDSSAIDERHAAASAGLGIIGDNGLLIHPVYASLIFIGEIYSDLPVKSYYLSGEPIPLTSPKSCEHCGQCRKACPIYENPFGITECLSSVTQMKKMGEPAFPRLSQTVRLRMGLRYLSDLLSAYRFGHAKQKCTVTDPFFPRAIDLAFNSATDSGHAGQCFR